MKFFLDTANLEEIQEAAGWGVLDGVTTRTLEVHEGTVHDYDGGYGLYLMAKAERMDMSIRFDDLDPWQVLFDSRDDEDLGVDPHIPDEACLLVHNLLSPVFRHSHHNKLFYWHFLDK